MLSILGNRCSRTEAFPTPGGEGACSIHSSGGAQMEARSPTGLKKGQFGGREAAPGDSAVCCVAGCVRALLQSNSIKYPLVSPALLPWLGSKQAPHKLPVSVSKKLCNPHCQAAFFQRNNMKCRKRGKIIVSGGLSVSPCSEFRGTFHFV